MKLTTEILDVIRSLLQQRKPECKTTKYVDLTEYAPDTLPSQTLALLPYVMIWDPLSQFNQELYCPHCHQDEDIRNAVRKSTWCVRGKQTPRMLWDRAWWCALVGKFYSCSKGHNVVSYHVGFLKQLPSQMVPFLLTHAAGMTTACYDFAIKLLEQGHSFKEIENIMQGMFTDEYERKRFIFDPNLPELEDSMVISPSDQIIRHHFLNQFDLNKDLYQSQMDRIPFTQLHVVTNGEKFNVNIGVKERLTAGPKNTYKWNKLFDSMFMIFNEFGCIKAYGLTKDVCIDQIIQCLVALAPFNPETETISMSNYCCVSRDSILEAFPNASVVFDLDYAKNLLKEMINCNDDKHEIYKDLDSVFKTNLVTESANQLQMISNLNTFYSKWSKEENGALLNESFIDVMDNILLHVRNGCVPTKGQELVKEKTKKIFDLLSKVFQPLFLGVQSACAMVAHMVYVYNCQKLGNMKYQPIWSHQQHETVELVEFPKGIESEQELATEKIENAFQSEATQEIPETKESQDSEENQTQEINQEVTADVGVTKAINVEEPPPEELVQSIDLQNFSEKCQRFIPLGKLFLNIREIVFKLPVSHNHKSMRKFVSLMSEVWFNHDYLKVSSLYNVVPRENLFALKVLGLKETPPLPEYFPNTSSLVLSIYLMLKELCENKKLPRKIFAISQKSFTLAVAEKGIIFGEAENQTENLETLSKILSKEMIGGDETAYNHLFVESKKRTNPKQKSDLRKVKAEVDLATIYAAANVFGLPIMLTPTCKEMPILPIIPISKLEVCQPSFLVYGTENGFFHAYLKDNSEKKFFPCLCGLKSRRQKMKKYCIMVTCSCFSSGRSCTSLCQCCKCANNKPPESTEEIETVIESDEPTKKKKKRGRDYDFHRSTPIPNTLPPPTMLNLGTVEPQSMPRVKEVISPENMHHAFLDAFMFTLLREGTMIRSEDLPDILHGMFLEIRNEIVVDPMSREDEFLQYLAEIDMDFIQRWIIDNKQQRKLMKDFKQLCTLSLQPVVESPPKDQTPKKPVAELTNESPVITAESQPDNEQTDFQESSEELPETESKTTELVVIIEHLQHTTTDKGSNSTESEPLKETENEKVEQGDLYFTQEHSTNETTVVVDSPSKGTRSTRITRKRK